jgi:transposase
MDVRLPWGKRTEQHFIHRVMPRYETVMQAWREEYEHSVSPVGYSTLAEWWKHWLQYGELRCETTARRKRERKLFSFVNLSKKVTSAMCEYMRELLIEQPDLYLDEIQDALYLRGGELWLVSRATIWRALRYRLGWTLKLAVYRAVQRDIALRHEYFAALAQFSDPAMFVFIDESNRGRKESRRRRAWGPRGQNNSLDEIFRSDETSFTLMGAADIDGFVLPMIDVIEAKRGPDDNDPTRGTVDTERFLLWVEERLCPNLGSAQAGAPRYDDATIHQDPRFRELVEAAGGILIYAAPYSPDLNPIEFCFHQYKAFLKRHYRQGRRNCLGQLHMEALLSVTHENMCNYYRRIGCIRNVPSAPLDNDACALLVIATASLILLR